LSGELPLRITRRAAREISEASGWWSVNHPGASEAFREEIERAFELMAAYPDVGSRALNASLVGVRRIYLSRIRYHLYYRIASPPEAVEVLALWHASRSAGPEV